MADYILNVKVDGVEQSVSTIGQLESVLSNVDKDIQAISNEKVFEQLNEDAKTFTQNVKQTSQMTSKMAEAIQQTAEASAQIQSKPLKEVSQTTEQFTSKAMSARMELRKITQELYNLEPGSARFQELSLRAGELRDQMGDTAAIIGVVAGNATERFGSALQLTLTQGVTALQGLQQGFEGAGIESEKLTTTLQVLQGVIGVASLISFAGALPDSIDQIKAGFASVITPIKTYIASLFATTAATEGATLATRALAIAQKALPVLAIAATITAVGVAIFDYFSATEKATKSTEELRKEEEAAAKARKEENIRIGEQASQFLKLVFALKNTNAGTKERKTLIAEINEQYGTTFKNLKDETKFQDQLNISVKEYIALQVLKIRQQKKEKEQAAAVGELIKAQDELNEFAAQYGGIVNKNGEIETKWSKKQIEDYDLKKFGVSVFSDGQRRLQFELARAQEKAEDFAISSNDLQKEIDKLTLSGKKYEVQTNTNTRSTNNNKNEVDDAKRAYEQLALKIEEWSKRSNDAENDLEILRRGRNRNEIERVDFELDLKLANIIKVYEQDKKFITENIKDKQKQSEELLKIETFKTQTENAIKQAAFIQNQRLIQQEEDARRALLDSLIIGQEILNKEFTFGNQNTNDTILAAENELNKQRLGLIETRLADTKAFELNEFNELQNEKILLSQQIAETEKQIAIENAQTQRNAQLGEIIKYYNSLSEIDVEYNDKTKELTIKSNEEVLDEQLKNFDILKKERIANGEDELVVESDIYEKKKTARKDFDNIRLNAEKFLTKQIENLNEEQRKKEESANIEFENRKVELAKDTQEKIFGINENILQEYVEGILKIADAGLDAISDLFNEIDNIRVTDQQLRNQQAEQDLARINQRYENEKQLETQRFQSGLITREAYNDSIKALDNQLDIETKKFNDNLIAQQNEVAQKTFNTQKGLRIAQTIISGIQGALDAYASAQSLPFGAGAVVGPILAAAVAATTAIAVRNIAKTQFNPKVASSSSGSTQTGSANIPQIGGGQQFGQSGGFTAFNTQNIGTSQNQTNEQQQPTTQQSEQRVYVVESDITSAQRRVKVLESQSTFN